MLSEARITQLLESFGLELSAAQTGQLVAYLNLLLHWNRKINLTAICSEEECITRHFGESLFISRWLDLSGRLLDVGSGAGFPGLALKIAFPALRVTLLEPVSKKRAFLKEVARVCKMDPVEVRCERLEEYLEAMPGSCFETVTSRAVGRLDRLVPDATRCLAPGGRLCLWLSHKQRVTLITNPSGLNWADPIPIPLTYQSEILVGTLAG
jgi:16S rRNA (guanine527-N7)-methyltransferase